MKKQLFFILLAISIVAKAQEGIKSKETNSQKRMTEFSKAKRHNLSVDVISAIAFPAFNPRYEYVISKYSGIGADLNINLDNKKGTEILEKFSFSPFYRQYFFSKEDYGAKGFYGEGFLKLYTYESFITKLYNNYVDISPKTFFETALGVGIGWKWVSDSGFLIDLNVGLGRNLGFSDSSNSDGREVTGKFGVNFGWQF